MSARPLAIVVPTYRRAGLLQDRHRRLRPIRRNGFDRLEGLDELCAVGQGDADFCLRLGSARGQRCTPATRPNSCTSLLRYETDGVHSRQAARRFPFTLRGSARPVMTHAGDRHEPGHPAGLPFRL